MPDGSQIDLSTGNGIVHQEILVIQGRGLVKDYSNERGSVVFKVLDMDRAKKEQAKNEKENTAAFRKQAWLIQPFETPVWFV